MPKRWKIARLAHEITMGNRLSSPANAEYAMEYVYVSHAGRNALLAVSPPCRRKKNCMVHGAYEEPRKKQKHTFHFQIHHLSSFCMRPLSAFCKFPTTCGICNVGKKICKLYCI